MNKNIIFNLKKNLSNFFLELFKNLFFLNLIFKTIENLPGGDTVISATSTLSAPEVYSDGISDRKIGV